jgi:hypothetical protein
MTPGVNFDLICIPDLQEHGIACVLVAENVTEVAKRTGLNEVEVSDINGLLESYGEELSVEDYK